MTYKHFKCPKCLRVSSSGEWDVETRKQCVNELQKKTYKTIKQAGQGPRWYQCPKCQARSMKKFIAGVDSFSHEA